MKSDEKYPMPDNEHVLLVEIFSRTKVQIPFDAISKDLNMSEVSCQNHWRYLSGRLWGEDTYTKSKFTKAMKGTFKQWHKKIIFDEIEILNNVWEV